MTEQQPHEVSWALSSAFVASRCLHVVAELGVADEVAEEPVLPYQLGIGPARGAVEGRPALVHRPPPPLPRRRTRQQHRRPHDCRDGLPGPDAVLTPPRHARPSCLITATGGHPRRPKANRPRRASHGIAPCRLRGPRISRGPPVGIAGPFGFARSGLECRPGAGARMRRNWSAESVRRYRSRSLPAGLSRPSSPPRSSVGGVRCWTPLCRAPRRGGQMFSLSRREAEQYRDPIIH